MDLAQAKRTFLWVMIVSISASALFAIAVFLAGGEISDREGRILGTTLLLGASSGLGLAAGAAWPKVRSLAVAAAGLAAIAFVATMLPLWSDVGRDSSAWGRTAGALYALAVSGTYAALLIWRRRGEDGGSVVAFQALALIGLSLLTLIVLYALARDDMSSAGARLLGAAAVLTVGSTLLTLLLRRLQRPRGELVPGAPLVGRTIVQVESTAEGALVVLDDGTRLPLASPFPVSPESARPRTAVS